MILKDIKPQVEERKAKAGDTIWVKCVIERFDDDGYVYFKETTPVAGTLFSSVYEHTEVKLD